MRKHGVISTVIIPRPAKDGDASAPGIDFCAVRLVDAAMKARDALNNRKFGVRRRMDFLDEASFHARSF